MIRKIILLLLPATGAGFIGKAQLHDSLKMHIDSAFIIMQRSLYSERVDWEAEKTAAYAAAASAVNKKQLFPVIAEVFKKLDDHHGWFQQHDDKVRLPWKDERQPTEAMKKIWAKGPKVFGTMIGDIAYLRIPSMNVYTQAQIDYCANWLADTVRSLAAKNPKGWIIDLRINGGGHIIPMMSGIASFFPEGVLSYYLDRHDKPVSHSLIKNKIFVQEDSLHANLKSVLPDLRKAKVAVLIGRGTGSSGEGVAYNFMNRRRTRLFGENSAGVANSTEGFLFNNEEAYFLLTTAKLGNKKKQPAPEILNPDVRIDAEYDFDSPEKDVVVMEGVRWVRE